MQQAAGRSRPGVSAAPAGAEKAGITERDSGLVLCRFSGRRNESSKTEQRARSQQPLRLQSDGALLPVGRARYPSRCRAEEPGPSRSPPASRPILPWKDLFPTFARPGKCVTAGKASNLGAPRGWLQGPAKGDAERKGEEEPGRLAVPEVTQSGRLGDWGGGDRESSRFQARLELLFPLFLPSPQLPVPS